MIEHNNTVELASNGITGFIDRYRMSTNTKDTKSIPVYFMEMGAYNFSFLISEIKFSVNNQTEVHPWPNG